MATLHADPGHHKALGCRIHQEYDLNWFCEYLSLMLVIVFWLIINNSSNEHKIRLK